MLAKSLQTLLPANQWPAGAIVTQVLANRAIVITGQIPLLGGGECVVHQMAWGKCNVNNVTEIVLPEGRLAPGASLTLPLWVRGPDESGLHDVRMLFYYETIEDNSKIR